MPTKVHLVKAMVFPVVIYGHKSWTLRKAKRRRIDAFELWCWRKLSGPLDYKEIKPVNPKGNQPWIFIGRTDAEATLLWHLMRRASSLEKTLMLGKIKGSRRSGQQRMRWLDGITDSMDIIWASSRKWWRTGKPGMLQFMGSQVGHDWATEQQLLLLVCYALFITMRSWI